MTDKPNGNGYNVIDLDLPYTTAELNPNKVLYNNIGEFKSLLIIGYDEDGDVRICGSFPDMNEWLALLEKTKHIILREVLA